MNNNNRRHVNNEKNNIKSSELEFIKKEQVYAENKINYITLAISISNGFILTYANLKIDRWWINFIILVILLIPIMFLLSAFFPYGVRCKKNQNDSSEDKDNFTSNKYTNWTSKNIDRKLKYQIDLSIAIIISKYRKTKLAIIFEFVVVIISLIIIFKLRCI